MGAILLVFETPCFLEHRRRDLDKAMKFTKCAQEDMALGQSELQNRMFLGKARGLHDGVIARLAMLIENIEHQINVG